MAYHGDDNGTNIVESGVGSAAVAAAGAGAIGYFAPGVFSFATAAMGATSAITAPHLLIVAGICLGALLFMKAAGRLLNYLEDKGEHERTMEKIHATNPDVHKEYSEGINARLKARIADENASFAAKREAEKAASEGKTK